MSSRSALEGERKQVSVHFVDVSGFTALSERLDPEDVHGFMNRAFELMLGEVHGSTFPFSDSAPTNKGRSLTTR